MNRTDLIVVGAGPAGMSAAIEAAKRGAHVTVLDENSRPGGQLFKQIKKVHAVFLLILADLTAESIIRIYGWTLFVKRGGRKVRGNSGLYGY